MGRIIRLRFLRSGLFIVGLYFFLIGAYITLTYGLLPVTGDEPRLLYYGVSFFKGEFLTLDHSVWGEFLKSWHFTYQAPTHFLRKDYVMSDLKALGGIVPSIIASIGLIIGGPVGGRVVSMLCGLVGIAFLLKNMERFYRKEVVWASTVLTLTCVTFLSHFLIVNLDIYLFTFASISLYFLFEPKLENLSLVLLPLTICVIPLMHTRGCYVAGWLMLVYYTRVWMIGKSANWKPVVLSTAVGAMVFFLIHWFMYGRLSNMRSVVFEIKAWTIPTRILLEWLWYRHGLFINAPIAIIGLIGLIYGSIRKDWRAFVGLVAFLIYSPTIIIQDANESFPARLWVFLLPFFVFGTCVFIERCRQSKIFQQPGWILLSVMVYVQFLLVMLFLKDPSVFIMNRAYSFPYDAIFRDGRGFNFAIFLPVKLHLDDFNFSAENQFRTQFIFGLLFLVGSSWLVWALAQKKKIQRLAATVCIMTLVLIFDLSSFSYTHIEDKSCNRAIDENGLKSQSFQLDPSISVATFGVGDEARYWLSGASPDYPKELSWKATLSEGAVLTGQMRLFPILFWKSIKNISEITFTEVAKSKADWQNDCGYVFIDQSYVRKLVRAF